MNPFPRLLSLCLLSAAGMAPGASAQGNTPTNADMGHMDMAHDMDDMDHAMMALWSEASRMAAQAMMDKYGAPDETTPTMLVWHNTGPFMHTVVHSTAVPHRFPMPHDDVLEQFVLYEVPPEMYDDLAEYDGSVMLERTSGKMSARCDKEPMNILALNLAHQIVSGEMDVEEARETYAEQAMAFKQNQPAPFTERLLFTSQPMGEAADPDEPVSMDDGM